MRVVHVLHSMQVAGAEVLVRDFIRGNRDHLDQHVVTLDTVGALGESLRAEGIPVWCLERTPGVDLALPLRLAVVLDTVRPDVVHAHQYTPYFYSALGALLHRPRPALVFTEHGRHVPDHPRWKRVLFNQFALRWTDRVTAVCGYVKDLLVQNERIDPARIEVVYNGVDPSRFSAPEDPSVAREALGWRPDELVVTCVARFHPVKDHATLVRGFAQAHALYPKSRLVLVGDGPLQGEIEALVRSLGMMPSVTMAGPRTDIPRVLAASDLFAMTSLSEGTSVTLLEAMLSARPAVVTAVGGNPEIVEDGVTGLLVPRGDAERTGAALSSLLANAARRQAMGRAGRARALERFTQERMHAAWRDVYRAAVHAAGRGGEVGPAKRTPQEEDYRWTSVAAF